MGQPPKEQDATPRLLVGLGNPGKEYEGTRHNVGFEVADRLAARLRADFAPERKWKAHVAKAASGIVLVKPQTYMNLSGAAAQSVASFFKIPPAETLVIYDDVDLPLGTVRFRPGGSAGGHNGMKSIIQRLGTDAVPRLKIGIGRGRAAGPEMVGHVLGKFSAEERSGLENSLDASIEAVLFALEHGLQAAMNRFNRRSNEPAGQRSSGQSGRKAHEKPGEPAPAESPPDPSSHPDQEKNPAP
ncbi:MAG: aminoacyl-tRNA hydrolase [Verrucomicrobiales bacterium]